MKPLNAQTNSPSFQNKLDNLSQQHLVQSLSLEQSPRIIKRNFRLKRSKKKPVDDNDYNSLDKSSNDPIELLSESIENQLQNEIFWTDDAQQQHQKDFSDRSEMNSSQNNATQTQAFNVSFTTTTWAVNKTTISSTRKATEAEIPSTESFFLDNTTSSTEATPITPKIISLVTTTYIVPTTTTVPTQVINVENLTDPQKKILDTSKMNHYYETSSPSNIFRKKIKAQTKPEDNMTKNIEIPIVDWTSIMNNDSEKTIYETFYELLDNGYDYQNRHNFGKNANKKNKIRNQ
jgi:hypothetical protein